MYQQHVEFYSKVPSNQAPKLALVGLNAGSKLKSISVVFPAFNEEENIEQAIKSAHEVMSMFFHETEIIVVNDGSSDETGAIIDRLSRETDYVVPIHHEVNRGYGATLRIGIQSSTKDLIFFTDSDLQFDIAEIGKLLKWVENYDIVAGYREKRADPWHRKLNAWGWNRFVWLLLGLKVRDIDCAFKLFHRRVFEHVRMESVGAMINTEILTKAHHAGMRLKEVPVSHYERSAGMQSGADLRVILRAFRELLKMRKKLRISYR
jgi:glycosyltransferase involved in cell wall biosynthesis